MALEHIQPHGMNRSSAYSHVVKTTGQLVLLAGQTPLDEAGEVVGDDLETQVRQVFHNIGIALAAVGATPGNIAKTTTYIVNYTPEMLPALQGPRDEFMPSPPPASTLLGVASLARPEFLVEIDVIAVLD